jgi:hypothetical protein
LEKITKEIIIDFINKNQFELSSTQTKLCLPVINRIYRKMTIGIKFSGIKVDDNLICDGHHRYLASVLADVSLDIIPGMKTAATIPINWKSVAFDEEDWDTPAKIKMLNEQDAVFNDMAIEKIVELLK